MATKKDYINFYKEYVKALECNVLAKMLTSTF